MKLRKLVNLYRNSSARRVENGRLYASVSGGDGWQALRDFLEDGADQSGVGRVDDLTIDGKWFNVDHALPASPSNAEFEITLAEGGSARFYQSIGQLVQVAKAEISRGTLPKEYFLYEDNLYSGDPGFVHPLPLVQLETLINGLKERAVYHDERRRGDFNLVFLVAPDGVARVTTTVMPVCVDECLLEDVQNLDLDVFRELRGDARNPDFHLAARQDVFSTSIAEFLRSAGAGHSSLRYLICHWESFISTYRRDLATYLSGFSFHRARREVANAQIEIAAKFSDIATEIGGKALSVPVALVAILAFPEGDLNWLTIAILVLGMAIASYTIFATVVNQARQFDHICTGKDLTLAALQGNQESYPQELKDAVAEMSEELGKDVLNQRRILSFVRWIAWAPLLATIVYIISNLGGDMSATGFSPTDSGQDELEEPSSAVSAEADGTLPESDQSSQNNESSMGGAQEISPDSAADGQVQDSDSRSTDAQEDIETEQ